jgi:flavin-dependent dehydrogenase
MRVERDAARATVLHRHSSYCFMTVRQEFDDFCFRKTLAARAHFRRIRTIQKITADDSGVTLVVDDQSVRARFVIGADGVHSQVRQLTGAGTGWFWRAFALEATIPSTNAGQEHLVFDFAPVRDGYGWIFPKGDHLNIGLYSYASDEKIDRARLASYIHSRLPDASADSVIGQYAGFGAAQHRPGPGRIFLVGDAGGFVDPLTGEGIYFAVVTGQAAAAGIEASLCSGIPAHEHFTKGTAGIRADLAITTSAARWFYQNLDQGYRFLSMRLLQPAMLNAFANGTNLARLAGRVRGLTGKTL